MCYCFMCMSVSPTCMSDCVPWVCNACGGMKAIRSPGIGVTDNCELR